MLLSVQNLTKYFLDKLILKDINLNVVQGDRIGLLGVNGAGKTTLLNLITGSIEPDEGAVIKARGLRIGYLKQNDALSAEKTIQQEANDAFSQVFEVKRQLDETAQSLATDPENAKLLLEYGRLSNRFEAMDGYHTSDKINRVLNGLGFGVFSRETKVATLSGGEKMRFGIAKMLLQEPDILILDEPTNHLDFSMLAWLERYLETYKGAVITVSHDRYFLDAIAKNVCEIENCKISSYTGGYSGFLRQKAERRKLAAKLWAQQQEEIAKLEEFVRKNLAKSASVAGVGTRVKQLEKMERLPRPLAEPKAPQFRFMYDNEPFSTILQCENLGVSFEENGTERQLFSGLNLTVQRGEKVALVGLNGVGKSTFLKAVQNLIPHQGLVRWGGNVRIGYFDQELAGLDLEKTALEAVHSQYPTKTEFELRSLLGRYLLEGEDVYKKVRELSGANRAKVAFTILELKRANVLVLDEPTNHMDYRAKESMEQELRRYSGTLIAVSHDRYFLRKIPDKILEMTKGSFKQYIGNYDYYLEKKQEEQAAIDEKTAEQKKQRAGEGSHRTKQQRATDSRRRNEINSLEREMQEQEQKLADYQNSLQDTSNASDYELLQQLTADIAACSEKLELLGEEWLLMVEE